MGEWEEGFGWTDRSFVTVGLPSGQGNAIKLASRSGTVPTD